MEFGPKKHAFRDIGDDARRQYIDAESAFTAWEAASAEAVSVRGGMHWKAQGEAEYLIRTSGKSQKSLGVRSAATEDIHGRFIARKEAARDRLDALTLAVDRHQRMNRALRVGRVPRIVVDVLAELARAGVDKHFTVIGTHALYAYEATAGVRIGEEAALATQDVDLLWDTRNRVQFVSRMGALGSTMIGLLQKADPSFSIREEQPFTAANKHGFEVDIIRREAKEGDDHPLQLTDDDGDFWAVQATRAGQLLSAPKFSAVVAAPSGHMARMTTVSPVVFCDFKRWMSEQKDRLALKRSRDRLQAEIVEQLVHEYLPQWILPGA